MTKGLAARGSALLLLAILLTAPGGNAEAEEPTAGAPPIAGRFTMVPAEGGFVRLDTQTGLVSHCRRETSEAASPWRCAAIPEDVLNQPDRLGELSEQVDALTNEVAALRMRLDAADAPEKTPTDDRAQPAPGSDEEMNQALDFSEELMRRFFGLVQEMKRSEGEGRT